MDFELDSRERLKVLPHVTVLLLQQAFLTGFQQLGHRNLESLLPTLQGMNWNTAPFKHLQAFVLLESLLIPLLQTCHNGLIPDRMSMLALKALHEQAPFTLPDSMPFPAVAGFLCLKLRQMASKVRTLSSPGGQWESFARKLSAHELKLMLRYCRCLDPNFLQARLQFLLVQFFLGDVCLVEVSFSFFVSPLLSGVSLSTGCCRDHDHDRASDILERE